MKLVDLHPELSGTLDNGHLYFDCPCGSGHTIGVRVARTQATGIWAASGDSIATLTVHPSIQVMRGCMWHGFIRNGEVVPA